MKQSKWLFGISGSFFGLFILFVIFEAFLRLFTPPSQSWAHIVEFMLPNMIESTLILTITTGMLTAIIGFTLAYFVTVFDFWGRKWMQLLLFIPLAIPPYILTYTLSSMFSYTGIVQTFFRNTLQLSLPGTFFHLPPMPLAIYVFVSTLFPYVYITSLGFLKRMLGNYVETALTMQKSYGQIFKDIALPLSMPAILAGVLLVVLEVIGDFGVVMYLNIPAFSTSIFRSWVSLGDFDSALRLSAVMMGFVFLFLMIVGFFKKKTGRILPSKPRNLKRKKLTGLQGVAMSTLFITILTLFLVIPVLQLLFWSWASYANIRWTMFINALVTTLISSVLISGLIVVIALLISTDHRIFSNLRTSILTKISILGYSIPGSVVAMLVLFFFIQISSWLKFPLHTSMSMLVVGLVIRYLGLGIQNIAGGYRKIGTRYHEAAQTLGKSYFKAWVTVDIPLLLPALLSGFALVFIDVIKELPLTLNLRPFNYHTLATQVYQYASDEQVIEAAIPSLVIILLSALLIWLITYPMMKEDV